ncbi:MAG: hypothetical protein WA826_18750 [Silvibacterium sp.]
MIGEPEVPRSVFFCNESFYRTLIAPLRVKPFDKQATQNTRLKFAGEFSRLAILKERAQSPFQKDGLLVARNKALRLNNLQIKPIESLFWLEFQPKWPVFNSLRRKLVESKT